jgi:hypothetical protein
VPPTTALAISITIGSLGLISSVPGALLTLRAELPLDFAATPHGRLQSVWLGHAE